MRSTKDRERFPAKGKAGIAGVTDAPGIVGSPPQPHMSVALAARAGSGQCPGDSSLISVNCRQIARIRRRAVLSPGANPKRAVESRARPLFRRRAGVLSPDGAVDQARKPGDWSWRW